MAFNVANLTDYIDELTGKLQSKLILPGDSYDSFNLITGIKGTQTVNEADVEVSLQDANCGAPSDSGDASISQVELTVTPIQYKNTFCWKDLEVKYLGMSMAPGAATSGPATAEAIFADTILKKFKEDKEYNMWIGDTHSSPGYGKIDGYLYLLSQAATRIDATVGTPSISGGPYDATTIKAVVDYMVSLIPEEVLATKSNISVNMSIANYMYYIQALAALNLYNANPNATQKFNAPVYGVDFITVKGRHGLKGRNEIVVTYDDNLLIGADMAHEEEKFVMKYDEFNDIVYVNVQDKLGVQIWHPEYCVTNF